MIVVVVGTVMKVMKVVTVVTIVPTNSFSQKKTFLFTKKIPFFNNNKKIVDHKFLQKKFLTKNIKTEIVMKLKNSTCDETKKNSSCDDT